MTELPIVLRPRIEGRALGGAFGVFFGLVLLVPGLAFAAPAACLAAVGVLAATAFGVFCASRHEIVFEAETVVERTALTPQSAGWSPCPFRETICDGSPAADRRALLARARERGGGLGVRSVRLPRPVPRRWIRRERYEL